MRYVVIGTSGSGKSSFAQSLAQSIGVEYVELDDVHWGPNWTACPTEEFLASVAQRTAGKSWVVDGNYSKARDVIWPRATHIVWLNYGRSTVFSRVLRRTLKRALLRQELWAGNRETFRLSFLSKDSILVWSVSTFAKNRRKYEVLRESDKYPHVQWLEFKRPGEAREFLQQCSAVAA